MRNKSHSTIGIVGSGPAGLMAAHVAATAGHHVRIFEKKKGPGRKLLIAGSSGLNITYDAPLEELKKYYDAPAERMGAILEAFPPEKWIGFIRTLGVNTFLGTSRRYFVEGMKASTLLRKWLEVLGSFGAEIVYNRECVGFETDLQGKVILHFPDGVTEHLDALCFALGGGSYEEREKPLRWPRMFEERGVAFKSFEASNVGYGVSWPESFLEEAEGKPLKNVVLRTSRGQKQGDLIITRYGIEGTPVYTYGASGVAHLDLAPDLSLERLEAKLRANKENLSPIRRAKKQLRLGEATHALLFHLTSEKERGELTALAKRIKHFPLKLEGAQPLDEAISSRGGIDWSELNDKLMLKRYPGVFLAGEMINWDAPTGGFLIQGSVSTGFVAGNGLVDYVGEK